LKPAALCAIKNTKSTQERFVGKLISIVGASGVGKTALVHALAKNKIFQTAYEQHTGRPFQALFKQDKRFALANQIDYLLLRAEQEKDLRRNAAQIGLTDGGLDLDFHGFTRLFLSRHLLSQPEFDLCRRLYTHIRETLPPPELIVRLHADVETVHSRMVSRQRINIASAADTALFNSFLDEWLAGIPSAQKMELDVSKEELDYPHSTSHILEFIERNF
jgi:deoxyadenosine/deoxycytidine kinase